MLHQDKIRRRSFKLQSCYSVSSLYSFFCQAPFAIYTAIVSINKFALIANRMLVYRYITILMLTLKSAVNVILYCWFSEKFIISLKTLFKRQNKFDQNSSTTRSVMSRSRQSGSAKIKGGTKDTLVWIPPTKTWSYFFTNLIQS